VVVVLVLLAVVVPVVPLVVVPVLMLQTPSHSMTLIGTAPLAARYATARFRFGAFASMAAVDTEISGRRQKAPGFKSSLRPN
jgi:hypothetical protein